MFYAFKMLYFSFPILYLSLAFCERNLQEESRYLIKAIYIHGFNIVETGCFTQSLQFYFSMRRITRLHKFNTYIRSRTKPVPITYGICE